MSTTTEAARHSGRDSLGRSLVDGAMYYATIDGVTRSCRVCTAFGQIGFRIGDDFVCLSQIEPSVVFSRATRTHDRVQMAHVHAALDRARAFREELARLESVLAHELGCDRGDGSPLWDGISAAVRDGMGTAVDLLELSGGLRR